MQLDGQLIAAAIDSRKAWEKIAAHFDVSEFSTIPKFWVPLIAEWYATDGQAQSIDRNLLIERGKLRIKNDKHRDMLVEFIQQLPEPPSPDNLVHTALEYKRFSVGMQLGAALGNRDYDKADVLIDQLRDLRAAVSLETKTVVQWQDAVAVEGLFAKVGKENRIEIAPARLNDRIGGGALPGHHIVVFARPEEGKSTFCVNAAGSFAKRQIRTLYAGNEDQIDILKMRAVSRVTGLTQQEMEQDPAEAARLYREAGGEEFLLMTQMKHGTVDALRKRVEEYKPQIIIVDQIRNMMTGTAVDADMTRKLERLAIEMRNLLLDYGLIGISVTQARDREKPVIFLGMTDIDSSHTGLPAQADLIVGIGSDDEMKMKNQRALSFPKNKLSSSNESHTPVIVTFDRLLSKVY